MSTRDVPSPPAPVAIEPQVWRVAAVACLAPIMTNLDSTIVNVALATIRSDLHASLATAQWIVSGYLLALALMLPLNGWLVDRLGGKRVFLGCISLFTVASLLCGAARTMDQLILFRIFQGMAGGLLTPMTQMMVARVAGRHLARVMGITAAPILIVPVLGPVVAGAVLKHASWPWLFYMNLPFGLLTFALAMVVLPADDAAIQRRPFDLAGFLVLSPGLACLLYGFEHAQHGIGYALVLGAGVLLIALFVWRARRKGSSALIDLALFQNRVFTAATTTQFFTNAVAFGGGFLIPLYLITGCGLTSVEAGWRLAPMGIGMLCLFPWMGFLTDKFGCRAVSATGAFVSLVGTVPFLWMAHAELSSPVLLVSLLVRGAGLGAIGIPSLSAAYASVPRERLAIATTAVNIVQRLGGPLATTIVATVIAVSTNVSSHAFTAAFGTLLGLHVLSFGAASRLPIRIPQRS